MNVDKPYPITFAGDWEPDNHYLGYFSGAWSGGIDPMVTSEVADLIVSAQEVMRAELSEEYRAEQDMLVWEGDVLVHTSGQDPDFINRIEPELVATTEGDKILYDVSFGWTWYVVTAPKDEIGMPTTEQREALSEVCTTILAFMETWNPIHSSALTAMEDGTHVFPFHLPTKVPDGGRWSSLHVANIAIKRDGTWEVQKLPAGTIVHGDLID